jgi:hypothetical protein
VQAEQVAVVFAVLVQAGEVGVEPNRHAVVVDAEQQRAALLAVEERGDGLDGRRFQRSVQVTGVSVVRSVDLYSRCLDSLVGGPSNSPIGQYSARR